MIMLANYNTLKTIFCKIKMNHGLMKEESVLAQISVQFA